MHMGSLYVTCTIAYFIFMSIEKPCCTAVSQLSQQLSGNSMTEFWEKCVIMKTNKINGREKRPTV